MFDFNQPLLLAGLLLGLASSLHCLGMCSGIATSLCLAGTAGPGPARNPLLVNLEINAGRITGYVVAGALVGGLGTGVFGVLDRSVANVVLRWAAAVALGGIGLSMLGIVPLPAALLRLGATLSNRLGSIVRSFRSFAPAGFFAAGCVWGLLPCAMVYAALFYAMLSGSWLNGATAMLGFGLGTLLPVMAAGLGLPLLWRQAKARWIERSIGVAIIALSVVSIRFPAASIAEWCGLG